MFNVTQGKEYKTMTYSTYKLGKKHYLFNKDTDQVIFDISGSYNHVQSIADYFNKQGV